MAKEIINVNIEPKEVLAILNKELLAAKVDSSVYEVNEGKCIVNVLYEKVFIRNGSNVALNVTVDNVNQEYTNVKIVTACAADLDVGLPIGTAYKFYKKVSKILSKYIIEVQEGQN